MMKFDVIIPVAFKDYFFLERTIPYIIKNINPSSIFIITNIKKSRFISNKIKEEPICQILDEDKLISNLSYSLVKQYLEMHTSVAQRSGWFLQQFIKMVFSLSPYCKCDYYLSWDADTIPLRRLSFFRDEHPLFSQKQERHIPYFETLFNLLHLKPFNDFSFITEHMVFKTSIMKSLIDEISNSHIKGENWVQKIINATNPQAHNPFSEFETYGNYCMTHYSGVYELRQLNTFRKGGYIAGRFISDKKLRFLAFDLDTISFELGDYPLFPLNILCYMYTKGLKVLDKLLTVNY